MAYAVQPNTAQAKLTTDEVVHLRRERERTNATGFDILAHMKNPPKGLDAALINNACRGAKVFMPTGAYSALKTAYAALPDISKTHFKPSKRHFATILAEKRRTGA